MLHSLSQLFSDTTSHLCQHTAPPLTHLLKAAKGHSDRRWQFDPVRQLAAQVGQVLALGPHHTVLEVRHGHHPLAAPVGDADGEVETMALAGGVTT